MAQARSTQGQVTSQHCLQARLLPPWAPHPQIPVSGCKFSTTSYNNSQMIRFQIGERFGMCQIMGAIFNLENLRGTFKVQWPSFRAVEVSEQGLEGATAGAGKQQRNQVVGFRISPRGRPTRAGAANYGHWVGLSCPPLIQTAPYSTSKSNSHHYGTCFIDHLLCAECFITEIKVWCSG